MNKRASEPLKVLSLGAGVQSSTLALMAAHGEIEGGCPDIAIFSDTGWEPQSVYAWLDTLKKILPFEVVCVTAGNLRGDVLAKKPGSGMPLFTETPSGKGNGILGRGCTRTYKIEPKERYVLERFFGIKKGQRRPTTPVVEQWFGISLDEATRMRTPLEDWCTYRYPLIYEHHMTRGACLRWMERMEYPRPPRSACLACPFHSDNEWRNIRDNDPSGWEDAVDFDQKIRAGGVRGAKYAAYVHRLLIPLSEVDLSTEEDHGQLSLFTNECEGMCGV